MMKIQLHLHECWSNGYDAVHEIILAEEMYLLELADWDFFIKYNRLEANSSHLFRLGQFGCTSDHESHYRLSEKKTLTSAMAMLINKPSQDILPGMVCKNCLTQAWIFWQRWSRSQLCECKITSREKVINSNNWNLSQLLARCLRIWSRYSLQHCWAHPCDQTKPMMNKCLPSQYHIYYHTWW